jgi:hypothetical protein
MLAHRTAIMRGMVTTRLSVMSVVSQSNVPADAGPRTFDGPGEGTVLRARR